jgi:hypothetical protein
MNRRASQLETVRREFEAGDRSHAIRQGAREAVRHWPKGRSFRSWVIVVERLDAVAAAESSAEQQAATDAAA